MRSAKKYEKKDGSVERKAKKDKDTKDKEKIRRKNKGKKDKGKSSRKESHEKDGQPVKRKGDSNGSKTSKKTRHWFGRFLGILRGLIAVCNPESWKWDQLTHAARCFWNWQDTCLC